MPRRSFASIALAAAPLLAFLACGRKAPAAPLPDPARIPDLSAWHQVGALRPSFAGPHRGAFQRTWLNAEASRALDENAFQPWPDGTQLVKEALTRDGRRLGRFWMSKERGQWVWGQAGVD